MFFSIRYIQNVLIVFVNNASKNSYDQGQKKYALIVRALLQPNVTSDMIMSLVILLQLPLMIQIILHHSLVNRFKVKEKQTKERILS
jgi:hypothetical protein